MTETLERPTEAPTQIELMSSIESPTIGKITGALLKAQANFKALKKDTANTFYNTKYASLEGVYDAIRSALADEGILSMQQPYFDGDGNWRLFSRLIHTSGEWFGAMHRIKPAKDDPQGEGSALTYARRYSLMALAGVAPEDDDGNDASQRQGQQRRQEEPPRPEPSGRKWQAEAEDLAANEGLPASKRVELLLALFGEAQKFQEMTPALTRKFTALGKSMREKAAADAKEAEAGATG